MDNCWASFDSVSASLYALYRTDLSVANVSGNRIFFGSPPLVILFHFYMPISIALCQYINRTLFMRWSDRWWTVLLSVLMVASMSPTAAFLATEPFKRLGDDDILQPELTVPFVLLLCLVLYIVLCLAHPSWQSYTRPGRPDLLLVAMSCLYYAGMMFDIFMNAAKLELSGSEIIFTVVVMALSLAGVVTGAALSEHEIIVKDD